MKRGKTRPPNGLPDCRQPETETETDTET